MGTHQIWIFMARGGLYALTSTCALLAGYVVQKGGFDVVDVPYLALPVIASVYFFMCYASRFHSLEFRDSGEQSTHALLENAAIAFFPVVALLLIVISLLLLRYVFGRPISPTLLIAFGLYMAMYVYYGRFLLHHSSPGEPIVRHRLFWPVILSIGIGLYYGLAFSMLTTSIVPLLPVGLILFVYIVSKATGLRMRLFSVVTSGIFVSSTTFVVLGHSGRIRLPDGVNDHLSLMLFCLTVSAYFAVFETWKITSDIAKTEPAKPGNQITASLPMSRSTRYSVATLATLMVSVWAMPLFFVFSGYGSYFLIGFVVHAFAAFVLWYLCGRGPKLISYRWGVIKVVAALLFLLLVVLATVFPSQPPVPIIKWLVTEGGLSLLFVAIFPMVGRFLLDLRRERKRDKGAAFRRVLLRRASFTRVLSLLCWIACFVLLTFLPNYPNGSPEYYKVQLAFNAYAACIFLCLVVEMLDFLKMTPGMTLISKFIVGFLYLTRTVTSLMIGLCVFLPSIVKGLSIRQSLLFAIPFVFAAIGGFALNDYIDAHKDAVNKPYRAIPSNRLTPLTVMVIGIASLSLATIFALYASQSKTQLMLYALTIVGVSVYNLFVRYVSLSKTLLTSLVSALPILFSVLSFDYSKAYIFLPVATAFFVLGREWLMDIRDTKGDAEGGSVTVPMWLGGKLTAMLGFLFQFLSVILLLPVALTAKSTASYSLVVSVFLALICLYPLWHYKSGIYQRRVIQLLWLPMLFGVMMLVA